MPTTVPGRPYGRGPYGRNLYSTWRLLHFTTAQISLPLTCTLADALIIRPPRWQLLGPCVEGQWTELTPS